MFRLAHISDLHLAPLPPVSWRQLMSKRITGYVNWHSHRKFTYDPDVLSAIVTHLQAQRPDHIAITGDLVNLGLSKEIARAGAWLEALGDPERITIVCGNHDAYVPGSLRKALRIWQPFATGDDRRKVESMRHFPVLRRRGRISLIACNSALATAPFMSIGRFGRGQGQRLGRLLEQEGADGQCRILLIHHPPTATPAPIDQRLVGGELFRAIVARHGAELVLHGHTHMHTIEDMPAGEGGAALIGVPSAIQAPPGEGVRPPAAYNLFTIDCLDGAWCVSLDAYGYEKDAEAITHLGHHVLHQLETTS
jgi:3',5'-cyclic AMP phosphodiesterase CpdA